MWPSIVRRHPTYYMIKSSAIDSHVTKYNVNHDEVISLGGFYTIKKIPWPTTFF